ncbi:unnamed protein product, partial [marine sediment metagenome]
MKSHLSMTALGTAFTLFLACLGGPSEPDVLAGGSTIEVVGVVGVVRYPDGTPASGADVVLRRASVTPGATQQPEREEIGRTSTDGSGFFHIETIQPGALHLEAKDSEGDAAAALFTARSPDTLVSLDTLVLTPLAVLKCSLSLADTTMPGRPTTLGPPSFIVDAFLFGHHSWGAYYGSQIGKPGQVLEFDSLPAGVYHLWVRPAYQQSGLPYFLSLDTVVSVAANQPASVALSIAMRTSL